MFRRTGKTPDKDTLSPLYKEEMNNNANYLYNTKKADNDIPPRLFDTPSPNYFSSQEEKQEDKMRYSDKPASLSAHPFQTILKEETPETTLGEGVTFRGELSFERLLRIDGIFEGELLSQGKVIIGPNGKVKANLNLREAIIEGSVEGNITIQERLELRGKATVRGDISASSMVVDEGVTIIGMVAIAAKETSKVD